MQIYDFCIDSVNFEIFPNNIWQEPNIVFHGTSEYHSQEIENNGFIPSTPPFNINDARELLRVLQLSEIIPFDQPNSIGITLSKTLNNYIFGIEHNNFRLSFAYLSLLCVFFSTGQSKGGQVFRIVREAKLIIQQAVQANQNLQEIISEPINRLFNIETIVANANGVVYAVRIESPYNGIKEEYGNIHSTLPISDNNIIGKVILPNDINTEEFTIQVVKQKNLLKLLKPGHLGIILKRMSLNENDEI